jgi:hypothetical protein
VENTDNEIDVTLIYDTGTLDAFVQSLKEVGGNIKESKEFGVSTPPTPESVLLYVTAAMGIAMLANYIVERFRGGVLIDATKDPIEVRRDRKLPSSRVVIITGDDKQVTIDNADSDELASFITAVISALN